MMSHQQPIVSFGKTLINLSHVESVRVVTGSYECKMEILFTSGRKLMWAHDTETSAYASMERFKALNETFIMSEFL